MLYYSVISVTENSTEVHHYYITLINYCSFLNKVYDATYYSGTESDNENEVPSMNVLIHVSITIATV